MRINRADMPAHRRQPEREHRARRERPGDAVKPGKADGEAEGLVKGEQHEVDVARGVGGAALNPEAEDARPASPALDIDN